MNRLLQAGVVGDLDRDGRSLPNPQQRSGDATVIGEHAQRRAGDGLTDRSDLQRQDAAVGQRHSRRRRRLGEAAHVLWKQVVLG
jgi:hypothetical protein